MKRDRIAILVVIISLVGIVGALSLQALGFGCADHLRRCEEAVNLGDEWWTLEKEYQHTIVIMGAQTPWGREMMKKRELDPLGERATTALDLYISKQRDTERLRPIFCPPCTESE